MDRLHEGIKEMAEQGTFTEFTNGYPGGKLNKMFS
jgi:methylisocitrate lyase